MSDVPTSPAREISSIAPDTSGLKALAHPERLRMLALLRVDGPATASGLARRLGLNSGATSYHLRQLAAHGFIEEAEQGTARERWWRARHETTAFDTATAEGAAMEAGLALSRAALTQQVRLIEAGLDQHAGLSRDWRAASTASDAIIPLDADAARALHEKLMALIWEAQAAAPAPGTPLPEGVRPFVVMLHAFPFPDLGIAEDGT